MVICLLSGLFDGCGLGHTLPHEINSQIKLSESRTNKWVRPDEIDSALQANGRRVGSGT